MKPDTNPTASETTCPECGARVPGGLEGCRALFDSIGYRWADESDLAAVHWQVVDTYAMQHVEQFCVSAKSYAAHLTGLCCGVEHGGEHALYAAIQRWLNGRVELEKPEAPRLRGAVTLAEVLAAEDASARVSRVREWTSSVWEAYAAQHGLARAWIEMAQTHRGKDAKRR